MSVISAGTTSTTAFKVTGDTTGTLQLQTGAVPTTAINISASQVVTFPATTTLDFTGSLLLGDGSASAPTLAHSGDTNTGIYFPGADQIAITTAGTQRFVVDAIGNIGVGVTPSTWGSGSQALQNQAGALFTVGTGSLRLFHNAFYDGTNNKYVNTAAAAGYIQAGGAHQWFNAASGTAGTNATFTQAMTLDASGNLGLGVTPSAWGAPFGSGVLEISGGYFAGTSASNVIRLSSNNYYSGANYIYKTSAEAAAYVQSSGTHQWFTAPSGIAGNTITFTQALTLNTSGNLVLQGGTTTAGGVGVTFPATQSASSNANTLDDYEEGTWTPTIIGQTTNPTVTYSIRVGYYTKIGRVVSINGIVLLSAYSGGSGVVYISGLPFTVANDSQNFPVGPIGQMSGFTSGFGDVDGQSFVIRGDAGTTNMSILESRTTTTYDWTVGNLSATFLARFSLVYNT